MMGGEPQVYEVDHADISEWEYRRLEDKYVKQLRSDLVKLTLGQRRSPHPHAGNTQLAASAAVHTSPPPPFAIGCRLGTRGAGCAE